MTDARQVIARQMTGGGDRLLLALEPLDDGEFYAVNPNGFSAAWVTGHVACVPDLFSSWFGSGLVLDRGVHQVFNNTAGASAGGQAVDRERYPKDVLLELFCRAQVKALRVLRAFGLEEWDAPAPPAAPVSLLTGGAVWEALGPHTWWHCAELAGSMKRFYGTTTLGTLPHRLYVPPQ